MEPTIYKPSAYKSPGVYKGAGEIYKGRGMYKDGAGQNVPNLPFTFDVNKFDFQTLKQGNVQFRNSATISKDGDNLRVGGSWLVLDFANFDTNKLTIEIKFKIDLTGGSGSFAYINNGNGGGGFRVTYPNNYFGWGNYQVADNSTNRVYYNNVFNLPLQSTWSPNWEGYKDCLTNEIDPFNEDTIVKMEIDGATQKTYYNGIKVWESTFNKDIVDNIITNDFWGGGLSINTDSYNVMQFIIKELKVY